MGGMLHLVQRGAEWAGPQPAQSLPHYTTKYNSPSINGQYTVHHIAVYWSIVLRFSVPIKGLMLY